MFVAIQNFKFGKNANGSPRFLKAGDPFDAPKEVMAEYIKAGLVQEKKQIEAAQAEALEQKLKEKEAEIFVLRKQLAAFKKGEDEPKKKG